MAAQLSVQPDFEIVAVDGFCDFADDDCVNLEPTGMFLTQGQFHTISIEVDPAGKTWGLLLDGVRYNAPDPLDFRGAPTQLDTIGYLNEISSPNGSYLDSIVVGPLTPPNRFLKEFIAGPDRNGDHVIDRVLAAPATGQSEFTFQIAFTQPQVPAAVILDIVPAEWEIVSCVPDGAADVVLMSNTGKKHQNKFFDTLIQWFPDDNDGVLTCTVRTRKLKKGFEPKAAGRKYLNRGARAIDAATLAPLLDGSGESLVTTSLFVGAIADANKDRQVDVSGNGDEDGDTLTDFYEIEIWTNPAIKDTDKDKVPDNLDPDPRNRKIK
jgi:hypothetical protein